MGCGASTSKSTTGEGKGNQPSPAAAAPSDSQPKENGPEVAATTSPSDTEPKKAEPEIAAKAPLSDPEPKENEPEVAATTSAKDGTVACDSSVAGKSASNGDGAVSDPAWATEYCVFGVLSSKDDKKVMDLYKADGRLQVDEEVGAPRLSYLGPPTAAHGPVDEASGVFAAFEAPCKKPSKRVYWLASFNDKECYNTEHKSRPSNEAFVPEFMSCWANWPEEGLKMPDQKNEVFALAGAALEGQYMGPYWHLEKPGKSVDSDVFTTVVYVKATSPAVALEIISLNKAQGIKQLTSEPGALRYSIIPPHKVGVKDVGATDMLPPSQSDDEITVTWIESFESQEAYGLHKATEHAEAFTLKMKELIQGEILVLEFAQAIHMAKPVAG